MSWWTTNNRLHPKVKNKFIVVFGATFYIPSVKSLNKPKVSFETKEFKLINHKFNYPGNATWEPVTIKFVDMNGDIDPKKRHEIFDTASFLWQVMNNTGYRYPYINTSKYRDPVFNKGDGGTTGHWIATKIDTEKSSGDYSYITTTEKSSTIANSFGPGLSGGRDTKAASSAKQRISIYQIDPDGYTVELWHLVNPLVKSISWGDLDYSDDNLVEYELQIVYDWAILDREAIGKEPEFSATEYTEFMKTIYLTNQLDVQNALEKRIQALREQDEKLENQLGYADTSLKIAQETLEKQEPGSVGYVEALDELVELSTFADELQQEREKLFTEQEDILKEITETYGEGYAESFAQEFTNDLNLIDDLDVAEDFFDQTKESFKEQKIDNFMSGLDFGAAGDSGDEMGSSVAMDAFNGGNGGVIEPKNIQEGSGGLGAGGSTESLQESGGPVDSLPQITSENMENPFSRTTPLGSKKSKK